jgi:hypothetical protein
MLLSELVKIFSDGLNIDEKQFNIILNNNNIKLSQTLTLEKKNVSTEIKEKRPRGRPKKVCNIITESNTLPEDPNFEYHVVEEVVYNNTEYYKTINGALLDANYKVQGIIENGVTIMKKQS